jgi:hypothetical protein
MGMCLIEGMPCIAVTYSSMLRTDPFVVGGRWAIDLADLPPVVLSSPLLPTIALSNSQHPQHHTLTSDLRNAHSRPTPELLNP